MSARYSIRAAALWGSLTSLTVSGIVGCYGRQHSLRDQHAEIAKGAMPSSNGAFVREFMYRQAAKAEADDFVLYHYEWVMETAQLGPFGRRHLAAISKRLEADAPFGVMIEATEDPKLDEARYLAVTDILGQLGISDPATRVRIGVPAAEGLYGDEAQNAYGQLLSGDSNLLGDGAFGQGFGGLGGLGGLGGFGNNFGGGLFR